MRASSLRRKSPRMEGKKMEFPEMLRGDSLTRIIQGTLFGFILTAFIGFNYAGWTLEATAEKVANERVQAAIIAALTPICVEKFQAANDAKDSAAKLKATENWKQDKFIEQGGWATFAGAEKVNLGVASACAKALQVVNK